MASDQFELNDIYQLLYLIARDHRIPVQYSTVLKLLGPKQTRWLNAASRLHKSRGLGINSVVDPRIFIERARGDFPPELVRLAGSVLEAHTSNREPAATLTGAVVAGSALYLAAKALGMLPNGRRGIAGTGKVTQEKVAASIGISTVSIRTGVSGLMSNARVVSLLASVRTGALRSPSPKIGVALHSLGAHPRGHPADLAVGVLAMRSSPSDRGFRARSP